MAILADIQAIGPDEALKLDAAAKAGDAQAMLRFLQYASWRKLRTDRYIPKRLKPAVFEAIAASLRVSVTVTEAKPNVR